jgi:hypothetical protein
MSFILARVSSSTRRHHTILDIPLPAVDDCALRSTGAGSGRRPRAPPHGTARRRYTARGAHLWTPQVLCPLCATSVCRSSAEQFFAAQGRVSRERMGSRGHAERRDPLVALHLKQGALHLLNREQPLLLILGGLREIDAETPPCCSRKTRPFTIWLYPPM